MIVRRPCQSDLPKSSAQMNVIKINHTLWKVSTCSVYMRRFDVREKSLSRAARVNKQANSPNEQINAVWRLELSNN